MLIVPLGREGQSGLPGFTLLACSACVVVYLSAQTDAARLSLAYYPHSANLLRMLSSVFVHADILHLLGNLFFFYCFSRTVEIEMTNRRYLLAFLVFVLATNVAYSMCQREAIPTLGLSGVVWGFMGVFLVRHPKDNINCFVWCLWVVKKIEVPALIFILAFMALDIGAYRETTHDGVNHVAHISGFISGIIFSVLTGDLWQPKASPDARVPVRRGARRDT